MSLSASDTAAVLKAAQQGGLSASQGQNVVTQANAVQPAATTPVSPTPQITTPAVPTAVTGPSATSTATTPQQPAQTQPVAQSTQLAIPANGSVVDLLNNAGQDSSFTARQQLAKQYGIQNYTGTAAQNQELSSKYTSAYNDLKGTKVPQTPAAARSTIQTYQEGTQAQSTTQQSPIQQFMDTYGSMNPIEANIFQQLSSLTSSIGTQQSLTDIYKQEAAAQGLPALNLQLADINKVMDGTEDDIRDEITHAGGFVTESQVQAMTTARNKTLLKQANYLQNTINAKNDYVDRIVSLTQADREQVSKDLDQKLGIAQMVLTMANNMEDRARENYNNVVQSVGWAGLAQSLGGDPKLISQVENTMGLQPGELQALASYKKPLSDMEQAQLTGQQLQNQKLRQDLSAGPAVSTQVVDLGGKKVLINSKTGSIISDISATAGGTKSTPQSLAAQQQTIQDATDLLKAPGLPSTVGPNNLARIPWTAGFTGAQSAFIAGVEQLTQQLTLDQLVNAKANGATFGALSEGELNLLSRSATKINTWAIKDGAGNVTGYNANESDFKAELNKINNFQKLDYVLKGGTPASVGVQEQTDGTYWVQNTDGTYTQIQ